MANLLNAIRAGIYSKLSSDVGIISAVTQVVGMTSHVKVYSPLAPAEVPGTTTRVTLPYVVFEILPVLQDRDSASKWYTFSVQVMVGTQTLAAGEDLIGKITTCLEDSESSLSITGYTVLSVMRESQQFVTFSESVWSCSIQYNITIQ